MAFLSIVDGLAPRTLVLESGLLTVGRSPDSPLELAHVEVSRNHCRFHWDGKTCSVEDLESARGTSVNGKRITALTALQNGDRIGIGPVTLSFGVGSPHSVSSTPAPADKAPKVLVAGVSNDHIVLTGRLVLGRDSSADVILDDRAVSRRHAEISERAGGGWIIKDLNSSAGSFVNGRRFDQFELSIGDRLQIGPFHFQFDGSALLSMAQAAGGGLVATGISSSAGPQRILDNVSLEIAPSRFVGIIGPSGAGKSSLLHAVSGLSKPDTGQVLTDGTDVYAKGALPSFGFVPQEDIVHPELTVIEALRFSARLRLPKGTPKIEIQKLLLQTMDQLGLRNRADTPIGRLSGGQRKRVSVGVELLAKPSVLFLDEPTSGLDPATEFQLMELLRKLADTGCTIICTTHIMENAYLMDGVTVLVGGCLAFDGPPAQAREYFGVAKLSGLYEQLQSRPAKDWQKQWADSAAAAQPQTAAHLPPREPGRPPRVKTPWPLGILLHRQWAILRADWRNFLILLGQPLVIAALVSWVSDDKALIMFFAYLSTLWFGCSNAAQEIVRELAIYRRERLVGVGTNSYLASKFLFLSGITCVQALLLFGALAWFEEGTGGAVRWQLAALAGTSIAAVGIGSAISAMSRTVTQAVMLVPMILIPQIIFSGYTVPASDMSEPVLRVSKAMPSFGAQRVFDTSFLWGKRLSGSTISDFAQSYRNLDPDRELTSQDTFANSQPARNALLGHGAWLLASFGFAWSLLRRRR